MSSATPIIGTVRVTSARRDRGIAAGKDDVGTGLDHLRHPLPVLLCTAAKAARIDDKISTFDEPLPSQPIEEPRELGCRSRQLMQNAKPINSTGWRPVYHRLEDCIRAHVLPCWSALRLI